MKFIKAWWPLIIQILQIPLILVLFKTLPLQAAGLIASALFFGVGVALMNYFYIQLQEKSIALYVITFHIFLFVVPIIVMRLAFWGTPFSEIEFIGLKPESLHQFSEKFYLLVLAATFWDLKKMNSSSTSESD
ncbi:MAG: hypothetical protein AB8E15_11685 [Bdellovibrionales bacterium]